jgi:hypothetical protein
MRCIAEQFSFSVDAKTAHESLREILASLGGESGVGEKY